MGWHKFGPSFWYLTFTSKSNLMLMTKGTDFDSLSQGCSFPCSRSHKSFETLLCFEISYLEETMTI